MRQRGRAALQAAPPSLAVTGRACALRALRAGAGEGRRGRQDGPHGPGAREGITIQSAATHATWKDASINIIDTPRPRRLHDRGRARAARAGRRHPRALRRRRRAGALARAAPPAHRRSCARGMHECPVPARQRGGASCLRWRGVALCLRGREGVLSACEGEGLVLVKGTRRQSAARFPGLRPDHGVYGMWQQECASRRVSIACGGAEPEHHCGPADAPVRRAAPGLHQQVRPGRGTPLEGMFLAHLCQFCLPTWEPLLTRLQRA